MCASFHEKGCNNCAVVYKIWIGSLDRNLALFLSWKTHIWLDLPTVAKLLMATSYIFSHLENWTMGQRFQLSLSQQDAQWQLIVSDYCKSIMQLSSKVKVSFTLMSQSLIVSIVRENGGLQRNKKKGRWECEAPPLEEWNNRSRSRSGGKANTGTSYQALAFRGQEAAFRKHVQLWSGHMSLKSNSAPCSKHHLTHIMTAGLFYPRTKVRGSSPQRDNMG